MIRPLILALLLAGCAPTQEYIGALKFTTGASTVLVDASGMWHRFDQVHQQAIVDGATSLATGQQELASWRAERNRVDDAFVAARRAIATLADTLNAAGAAQKRDYGTALADVAAAVGQLTSLLAQYGVKVPILPAVLELRHIAPPFMVAAVIAGQEQCADSMPRISYGGRWLCVASMGAFMGGVR